MIPDSALPTQTSAPRHVAQRGWSFRASAFTIPSDSQGSESTRSKSDLRIDSDALLGGSSALRLASWAASAYRPGAAASRATAVPPRSNPEPAVAMCVRTFPHVVSCLRSPLITTHGACTTASPQPCASPPPSCGSVKCVTLSP
jgi:hypothetical protein